MKNLHPQLLVILLISIGGLSAIHAKPPQGHFGSQVTTSDGTKKYLTIQLTLPYRSDANPKFYRRAGLDWTTNAIEIGPYPTRSLKAERGGIIDAFVSINEKGKVTACEIVAGSAFVDINDHACPQLLKHGQFLPALNRAGNRAAFETEVEVSYRLAERRGGNNSSMLVNDEHPSVRATLNRAMTLAEMDISLDSKFPKYVDAIDGHIRVDKVGQITACTIQTSTNSDLLDKKICDYMMMSGVHTPARDREGTAVADDIEFEVSLPSR